MFAYRSILRESPRPAAVRESPRAPWLAVGVVCFGAFMGQLDASIVTITFPAMERDFGVPVAAVQWVSLVYLLGLVALLAPAGRLGDAFGRKLVYTYGFAVFTVASAACGLAPSLGALVALRLAQAVGAAMLQANSVALVTTSAPKERMRFALGVQAGAQSIGLALGPTLGGLLTATVGWRAVYFNVPSAWRRSSRAATCCRVPGSSAGRRGSTGRAPCCWWPGPARCCWSCPRSPA
jgi:MFS family permease